MAALFSKKEKSKSEEKKDSKPTSQSLSWVIIKPIVSEKAVILSGKKAYVFQVSPKANKIQIKKAVQEAYGVHPVKVNVMKKKARDFIRRGKKVHTSAKKKAVVFLKENESIELV